MQKISPKSANYLCAKDIYESKKYWTSKDVLFRWIKDGRFITPMKVGNTFFWFKSDVNKWFLTHPQA
nr:hypothetical protein [Rhodospirillales bacterium]